MKKLKEMLVCEYKYDTEEERNNHVVIMESQGFESDGQIRRSNDSIMKENREHYWFARFFKYE